MVRVTDYLGDIIQAAKARRPPSGMTTRIIAIDGPGGAGKTTLAERLAKELGGAQILRTDDFASWDNPVDWWPRLIEEVLKPLSCNQPARYRRSVWGNEDDADWAEVVPGAFVILEGVSASREAFRPFLTYSIWIETPRDVRLGRGLERNGEAARGQWEKWMAAEDAYLQRERPDDKADLVISGDKDLWRWRTP